MSPAVLALAVIILAAGCGASTPTRPIPEESAAVNASPTERPTDPVDELVTTSRGRMRLRCTGAGSMTVLLIAGWGDDGSNWPAVEEGLSHRTRVCSYTRFGLGDSDAPPERQTFESQSADLHALLATAEETGPYVPVGHSFGGAQAVTFAHRHPDEVAGLVLVDASPPTWPATVCSVPEYGALCDLMHHPERDPERLDVVPSFEAVAEIASLGDLPMTVVTAEHRSDPSLPDARLAMLDLAWQRGVHRWASLSPSSRIQTVSGVGHHIEVERPETVISAVNDHLS